MTAILDFDSSPLFALLDTRDPAQLPHLQKATLGFLKRIPAGAMSRVMSAPVAATLLETTRLGGLEGAPESDDPGELEQLTRARREMAQLAYQGSGAYTVGCVLPNRQRWHAMHVSWSPANRAQSSTILLDRGRQRLGAMLDSLSRLALEQGHMLAGIYLVRMRIGEAFEDMPRDWAFGIRTALHLARRRGPRMTPRWAAVGRGGPVGEERTLPLDIRVLLVEDGVEIVERPDWAQYTVDDAIRAAVAYKGGACIVMTVADASQAADFIAQLERV